MLTRKWDLSHLSDKDEMRSGAELNSLIMHFNQHVQDRSSLEAHRNGSQADPGEQVQKRY